MHEMASSSPVAAVRRIPGVAVMLIVLVAVFAANSPGFLSTPNLRNVLVQSTVLLLLALPMTLIIMTEGLDMSMGAVLTLASLVVAIVTLATGSVLLGLLAACAVGTVFGIVNGWLVAGLGIPPFVATLGTLGMAQGLSLIVSDGQSIVGLPRAVRDIYSGTIAAIPLPIVVAITSLGVSEHEMRPSTAVALVTAAVLSVLIFPTVAIAVRARARTRPAAAGSA